MSGETLYLAIFCNQSDEDTVPDNEVYRCVLEVRNGVELPDTNRGGFNDIDEIAEIHEAYGSERVWLEKIEPEDAADYDDLDTVSLTNYSVDELNAIIGS